jgi:integrase
MSRRLAPPRLPSLYEAALAPSTLRMYNANISKLLQHTRLTLPQLLSKKNSRIDKLVSDWIDALYRAGGSFDYAAQCVHGLAFHQPSLRLHLPVSRMFLRGWSHVRRSQSHPPITFEMTVLFASTMASWGFHAESVGALLAFDCFLRVGELTSIQLSDIVLPHDPRTGAAHTEMALRLPATKTGLNQWVTIKDKRIGRILTHFIHKQRELQPNSRVFPFSPGQFNRLIHRVAAALGLSSIPYVAHSFRHGGATCAFLSGAAIDSVIFRGRWRQPESARRYIQTGRALLITLSIPFELNRSGRRIGRQLVPALTRLIDSVPDKRTTSRRVSFAK